MNTAARKTRSRAAIPPASDDYSQESEAFRSLLDLCHRHTGAIPEATLVRHVLTITDFEGENADWPVQRAAMEALLRRCQSAHKEKLRTASSPADGRVLGVYTTRRGEPGEGQRPYTTLLLSADPPAGRCDCPDFLKSSLGLCKHLLALLDQIHRRPRMLAQAIAEQPTLSVDAGPPRLRLEPVRPLLGRGDWLLQVQWLEGDARKTRRAADPVLASARRWFHVAAGPVLLLGPELPAEPARRLELVRDLLALAESARDIYRDPALLVLLHQEEATLARQAQDAPLADALDQHLDGLKCSLYPYQREGVARFLRAGRLLLADDMGLGKTAQAIAACHALWRAGRVRRGLLCVPASLKPQWQREWHHFSDVPLTLVDAPPAAREALYQRTESGFLLINYEQVLRDLPLLQRFAPDMIVLDEAQRIKNWATKTAATIKQLTPTYRLVLTGTPMENRLDELASLMDWVDALAIEPKWRLAPLHTVAAGSGSAGGARHLETLRARLAGSMLRRLRSEVLTQLPSRTDTRIPVAITPQQREEHDELLVPIARLVNILKRRPLTPEEHLRLMVLLNTQRVIANGLGQLRFLEVWPSIHQAPVPEPTLREGLFAPKLEVLRELIAALVVAQGRKVVIFSQWRRMLLLAHWVLRDVLGDAGLRAVFFTGAESPKRRTHNIVDFHDDPDARVMFLTDAGGVGLNLQRAASCCINLELPWNPAVLEQRIGRIFRMGQTLPIDVYNLVTEASIEARIAELLGSKRALFDGLFDGTTNEVRYEQANSFLARVEQLVPEALLAQVSGAAPALASAAAEDDAAITVSSEDDEALAAHEVDGVIEAADESQDAAAAPVAADEAVHVTPPQIEASVRAEAPAPAPVAAPAPLSGETLRQLFSEVSIRRTPRGGLTIEASATAAETLAALFGGMAQLLGQAVQPPPE